MSAAAPTLGLVGAGQLARMTYQASIGLGVHLRVLADADADSAARIARDVTIGSYRSLEDLQAFAAGCDVVTFDHELVDPAHLAALEADGHCLRPGPAAKQYAQDKLHQRERFAALGLPVPAYEAVEAAGDVITFAEAHGWPVVLKARRGGYDGRGVWIVEDEAQAREVCREGRDLVAEAFVPITRELAILVARRPCGDALAYPLVETVQVGGICHELVVPPASDDDVAEAAGELGLRVAEAIGATGIMAVELFETGEQLLINELALRPHNSGHWTIEGARTSQFQNHVRAVLDWPLGAPDPTAPAVVTVNVLGAPDGSDPQSFVPRALALPDVAVHLYGKGARPGRKLGHVTALGSDVEETRARARAAAQALSGREAA